MFYPTTSELVPGYCKTFDDSQTHHNQMSVSVNHTMVLCLINFVLVIVILIFYLYVKEKNTISHNSKLDFPDDDWLLSDIESNSPTNVTSVASKINDISTSNNNLSSNQSTELVNKSPKLIRKSSSHTNQKDSITSKSQITTCKGIKKNGDKCRQDGTKTGGPPDKWILYLSPKTIF